MPFSAAIFCAAGMTAGAAGFAVAPGGLRFWLEQRAAAAAFAFGVDLRDDLARADRRRGSFLTIFTSTPSAGAGSSSTTLSVSMSIRFSSRLTVSPSFLCQASSVASATDSESCGTLTSMIAITAPVQFFPGFR